MSLADRHGRKGPKAVGQLSAVNEGKRTLNSTEASSQSEPERTRPRASGVEPVESRNIAHTAVDDSPNSVSVKDYLLRRLLVYWRYVQPSLPQTAHERFDQFVRHLAGLELGAGIINEAWLDGADLGDDASCFV